MPVQNPSPLLSRFKSLDERIKRNLIQAGEDLEEIRDKELWRQGGFDSFKSYCESIGENYHWAWRQIQAAKEKRLPAPQRVPEQPKPKSKVKVPPPPKNLSNGQSEPPASGLKDGTGIEVPPEIEAFWNRNDEVQNLLQMVSRVRLALENAQEEDDALFRFVDFTGTINRLKMVYEEVQCGKSYAVCPDCNGVMFRDCRTCRGRGSLPKFFWDAQPEEKRKLREI